MWRSHHFVTLCSGKMNRYIMEMRIDKNKMTGYIGGMSCYKNEMKSGEKEMESAKKFWSLFLPFSMIAFK